MYIPSSRLISLPIPASSLKSTLDARLCISSSESMFVVGGVASEARAVAGPAEGGRAGEILL